MRSLLVGAGNDRRKKVRREGSPDQWLGELTTLDMDPDCGADIVWDLDKRPYPFEDDTFDEIAAYDVLEHIGRQGDWRGWFDEMGEFWRILKPGGEIGISVPIGYEAYADPGHTRFFHHHYFAFLNQQFYADRVANGDPVCDYRWYWKKNFDWIFVNKVEDHHLTALLRKA